MAEALSVAIVGGGPVGIALALALTDADIEVVMLEARPADVGVSDPRPIALAYGSRLILERLGVWDTLTPTAIEAIHVSQAGGFGRTVLEAADSGVPALGYVLEYAGLLDALRAAVAVGDSESARRAAHTLKGNGRTFGATELSALCQQMEADAANEDLSEVGARLDAVEAAWEEMRRALEAARGATS